MMFSLVTDQLSDHCDSATSMGASGNSLRNQRLTPSEVTGGFRWSSHQFLWYKALTDFS